MIVVNSWRSKKKQGDKIALKVRLGKLTLFDLYYDHSRKQFGLILLNFGVRTETQTPGKDGNTPI